MFFSFRASGSASLSIRRVALVYKVCVLNLSYISAWVTEAYADVEPVERRLIRRLFIFGFIFIFFFLWISRLFSSSYHASLVRPNLSRNFILSLFSLHYPFVSRLVICMATSKAFDVFRLGKLFPRGVGLLSLMGQWAVYLGLHFLIGILELWRN